MTTDDNTSSELSSMLTGTPLYENAIEFAKQHSSISCCALQRKFSIGYFKASQLMTEMVKSGDYVPPQVGKSASLTIIVDDKELPFTVEAHIDHLNTPDTISLAIHLRTGVSRISTKHINKGNAIGSVCLSTFFTSYIRIYRESLELLPTGKRNGYFGETIALDDEGAELAAHTAMTMISSSCDTGVQICGLQVFITASKSLKGKTISRIANSLHEYLAFGTPISCSCQCDDAMGDAIKVGVLAIGQPISDDKY